MGLFSALERQLPVPAKRRLPFPILYGFDQRPPAKALSLLAAQHLVAAVPTLVYALIVAQLCGLSASSTQQMVAGTLVGMGISTALNAWGGRLGGGSFFINMPNFDFLFVAPTAVAIAGLSGLAGVALVAALTCFILRPALPRMRTLLPPPVVGAVICMSGISFTAPSMHNALGINAAMHIDPTSALISGATLSAIVALSVWGGKRFCTFAIFTGIALGDLLALLFDRIHLPYDLTSEPWLQAPHPVIPTLHLPVALIGCAVLVSLLGQIYNVGCSVMVDKQTDADWRRPDMQAASGVLMANGIADVIGSFVGGIGTCISDANLALASASKSFSRYIGFLVALFLMGLAFTPKLVIIMIALLPVPVQGALQIYAALFLFVGGIELATTYAPSSRTTFVLGTSVCFGLTALMMPALSADAPESLKVFLSNGYMITGVVAFTLNLIFRLGTRQSVMTALHTTEQSAADTIAGFLETYGGQWGVRRDVLQRAILASTEAAELVAASTGCVLLRIAAHFNEHSLDINLVHSGHQLNVDYEAADSLSTAEAFIKGEVSDSALDEVILSTGRVLLRHLADKVSSSPLAAADPEACVQLHFEH